MESFSVSLSKTCGFPTLVHPPIISEVMKEVPFSIAHHRTFTYLSHTWHGYTCAQKFIQLMWRETHEFYCNTYSRTTIFVDINKFILFQNLGNKTLLFYSYKFLWVPLNWKSVEQNPSSRGTEGIRTFCSYWSGNCWSLLIRMSILLCYFQTISAV